MPAERPPRLVSLDLFRGLAVAAMILVNHQGDWQQVYAPLHHAPWNGCTFADLVFPAFILALGFSAHLSISSQLAAGVPRSVVLKRSLRRAAVIFGLGFFLNWFPGLDPSDLFSDDPSTLDEALSDQIENLRILGVLQRIGLVYGLGAPLVIYASSRVQIALAMALLGLHAALLLSAGPGIEGVIDRMVLDWGDWGNHLWGVTGDYDPEGFVSTLSALVTMLFGVLAGRWWSGGARLGLLMTVSAALAAAGLLLDSRLPINKSLWTPSYALFSAGVCGFAFAAIFWAVEIRGWRAGTAVFLVFGVNPLVAYFGAEAAATLLGTAGFSDWLDQVAFASWLPGPAASLSYAVCYLALCFCVLAMLHRRGIRIRIS